MHQPASLIGGSASMADQPVQVRLPFPALSNLAAATSGIVAVVGVSTVYHSAQDGRSIGQ